MRLWANASHRTEGSPTSFLWSACVVIRTSPKCVTSLPPVLQDLVPVQTSSAHICCFFPLLQEGGTSAGLQFFLRRNRAVCSFTGTGTSILLKLLEIYLVLIYSGTGSRSSSQLKAICELQVTAGLYWPAKTILSVWSLFHLLVWSLCCFVFSHKVWQSLRNDFYIFLCQKPCSTLFCELKRLCSKSLYNSLCCSCEHCEFRNILFKGQGIC